MSFSAAIFISISHANLLSDVCKKSGLLLPVSIIENLYKITYSAKDSNISDAAYFALSNTEV